MIVQEVINKLRKYSDPSRKKGMARFGIEVKYALGVSVPDLRKTAKEIGKDHKLAQELWKTKIHEARIISCFIDDPAFVKEKQMEEAHREQKASAGELKSKHHAKIDDTGSEFLADKQARISGKDEVQYHETDVDKAEDSDTAVIGEATAFEAGDDGLGDLVAEE